MSDSEEQKNAIEHTHLTYDPKRSVAEWVSLGISLVILVAITGLVIFAYTRDGQDTPVIEVQVQMAEVRQEGESYYLPVDVGNTGRDAASDITVQIMLSGDGLTGEEVILSIPFLGGGETVRGMVVVRHDPKAADIQTEISFLVP